MPRNRTDELTKSLLACGVLGGFGFIRGPRSAIQVNGGPSNLNLTNYQRMQCSALIAGNPAPLVVSQAAPSVDA